MQLVNHRACRIYLSAEHPLTIRHLPLQGVMLIPYELHHIASTVSVFAKETNLEAQSEISYFL